MPLSRITRKRRINNRRMKLSSRRNRPLPQRRNRLQGAINRQNRNGMIRNRRLLNFNRRNNFQRRIIFVGGLPYSINNRDLFQLFKYEGRILNYKIMKDRAGHSRGFGFLEFAQQRDAWRAIQKWNNTTLGGRIIYLRFKRRRRNNQSNVGNNFGNRNNMRINESTRGFRSGRGGRGLFRGINRQRRGY